MLIYSTAGLARALNIDHKKIGYMRLLGLLPNGEMQDDKGSYFYTAYQLQKIRKLLTKQQCLSKVQAADYLGMNLGTFHRLVRIGVLPQPTYGSTLRKYYIQEDVDAMKPILQQNTVKRPVHYATVAVHHGYYNITKAADYLDMCRISFNYWRNHKKLPSPTHVFQRRLYYTAAELDSYRANELADYYKSKAKREKGKK